MEEYINRIFNMDCLQGMSMYPDHSIDMILTDLPYGVTDCRWDSLIPFPDLWRQYLRVIKDNGAIVLTAAQPFTTRLISSQPKLFRYCWYWYKNMATGFTFAKHQPLRCVEEICVFYKRAPTYNPQGVILLDRPIRRRGKAIPAHGDSIYRMDGSLAHDTETRVTHYPRQLLKVKCERGLHPTQKPVELFEYMIRTYTNPGELVLDSCMGSGTTAAACAQSGRNYTGFEKDPAYFKCATERAERVCCSDH
jgi:site-specific DNA-methyltransferase (adenine-specific)